MSRETDSAPYPPDGGRGGAASYPSGTPPYGTRSDPAAPPAEEAASGEPRTETTLTTRVRINIPGSRPIPPVVVRTTVNDGEAPGDEAAAEDPSSSTGGHARPPGWERVGQAAERPAAPAGPAGQGGAKPASDWFAPRKGSRGRSGESTGQHRIPPQPGQDPSGQSQTGQSRTGRPQPAQAPPAPQGLRDLSAQAAAPAPYAQPPETAQQTQQMPVPGAFPEPSAAEQTPAQPAVPFPADPSGARAQDPGGFSAPPPGGPYGGGPEHGGRDGISGAGFPGYVPPADGGAQVPPGPAVPPGPGSGGPGQGGPSWPSGPTAGPATGDMLPLPPRRGTADQQPLTTAPPGSSGGYRTPTGADLTNDTLVSGIPAVPPPGPRLPEPSGDGGGEDEEKRFRSDPEPAPRGRSKLVLAVGALVLAAVGAYGVGLVMDHAQVPENTTVLGVDIGGKSRQQAQDDLDAVLGKRAEAPLKLRIGDTATQLQPDVAGLGIDTDATVSEVAHRDYNPVSVVGSLFGGERKADAKFVIDEEKLRATLEGLAAKEGSDLQEGMVKFVNGEPVGVPGKAGLAVDVDKAVDQVRQAYLDRAATGANPEIELPRTRQEPKVTQAEIDRAIKEFGEPAMSGPVSVRVGLGQPVMFSPGVSLDKFLTMTAVDGRLQPHFDLEVLEGLYGSAFAGFQVDHGGSVGPVTPRDVATTMLPLLTETDPAKRVGTMEPAQ